MVLNVDVAPTLLDLAGVTPPASFHGDPSCFPERAGGGPALLALAEFFPEKVNPRVPAWQAVRTDRWKYIHYPRLDGMDELYDLASDPGEVGRPSRRPGRAAFVRGLQGELKSLLESTRAEPSCSPGSRWSRRCTGATCSTGTRALMAVTVRTGPPRGSAGQSRQDLLDHVPMAWVEATAAGEANQAARSQPPRESRSRWPSKNSTRRTGARPHHPASQSRRGHRGSALALPPFVLRR